MIKLKDVSFAYKRSIPVLENIDLELKPGRIYGLLGKNGEGKTTLLNLMSGQLFSKTGICTVNDDIPGDRQVAFLQQLFILPEEINLPDVTADEYLDMYAPFYPTYDDEVKKNCFDLFEIEANKRVSKMSLGQRKKVAIALALAAHTPVMLMDEPTNGLDIPSKAIFRKLIAASVEPHQTLIISTHQVRDLESLIDSVVILDNRKILLNQSLEQLSRKLSFRLVDRNEKVFYSEPTPQGLIGVVERADEADTPISLELLFNAVTANPGEMKRMFNQ